MSARDRQSKPTPPELPGVAGTSGGNPTQSYQALVAARREIRNQLSRLENDRANLSRRLTSTNPQISGVDRAGIEKALIDVDAQIATIRKDLAVADAKVVQAASVPGTITALPPVNTDVPPIPIVGATLLFLLALPVVIAYSRRIWRRADKPVASPLPSDLTLRLDRLEQAVESVAIEVERVGEGQRFMTQLLANAPARTIAPVPPTDAERLSVKVPDAGR